MQNKTYTIEIGGKTLSAEFTDLTDQAHGSVMVRYGNTVVLATAVMSKTERAGVDFLPLSVEYEERFYAAGQILGSRFMRREGRPSDEAILSGRIIDRTIRPLFDHHIRNEIQVVLTILSIEEDDPDTLGVIAASLALGTSDIPWSGPVSAVRIDRNSKGEFITNPTYGIRDSEDSELDLLVCGKDGNINMVEVGGKEVSEAVVTEGFRLAIKEVEKLQVWQKEIIKEQGKAKREFTAPEVPTEIKELFNKEIAPKLTDYVFAGPGKKKLEELKEWWSKSLDENLPEADKAIADEILEEAVNEILHQEAIDNDRRSDGRSMDEVRPLFAKAGGISEILHGSGVFYRGGTHVLSALTLGGPSDSQIIDGMETQTKKRFIHHYNFPPFSVGETGRVGGFNRRMIGHGALAEKALTPVIPDQEKFPYTIRIVSESMASNGSTSMASVCGSTLALMDAGVPITAPVAGIASGLMMRQDKNGNYEYKVLTDIQGPEDHHGDMDFKVAGTAKGITAIQMDVKVSGVPVEILIEALEKARLARLKILETITKEISAPRPELSARAPKILVVKIKPDQIGMVIGSGGKVINEIKEQTGTEIDIEDDGSVFITGNTEGAEKARAIITDMTREYTIGEKFEGEVVKLTDFGAFVKLNASQEGLLHISEIAPFRIERVDTVLKVGQKVPIVIKEIDERGRLKLSLKDADPNFIKKPTGN